MWRRGLLAVEIGLSFLLVTTSGLLLRTIEHIRDVPLGFSAENRLVVSVDAPAHGLPTNKSVLPNSPRSRHNWARCPALSPQSRPGDCRRATTARTAPMPFRSKGQNMGQAGLPWAIFSLAGPGYFNAMHIPLLRGREVTAADTYGSQPVVVISAQLARQSFGNEDPHRKADHLRHG